MRFNINESLLRILLPCYYWRRRIVSLGWGGADERAKHVYSRGLWEHAPPDIFACSKVESGGILAHNEPRIYIRILSHLLMLWKSKNVSAIFQHIRT